jgi:HEAT repeat protein
MLSSSGVRIKAVDAIGNIGTHDALLALLDLAANESLIKGERDRALKHARKVIKSGY